MKLFVDYVDPKITKAVMYGVRSTRVSFDEIMKPDVFTTRNMNQLKDFIKKQVKLNCELTSSDNWYGGKKFTFEIWW